MWLEAEAVEEMELQREARPRPSLKDFCLFAKDNKKLLMNFKQEKFTQSV